MKYLCLGYFAPTPEDVRNPFIEECVPHMHRFYETGSVFVDAGLESQTKCLRRVGGEVQVTDGPFAEAKELIGGVFIIEAADMDDAIRIAKIHPNTQVAAGEKMGWRMEIRPIHYFKTFAQDERKEAP